MAQTAGCSFVDKCAALRLSKCHTQHANGLMRSGGVTAKCSVLRNGEPVTGRGGGTWGLEAPGGNRRIRCGRYAPCLAACYSNACCDPPMHVTRPKNPLGQLENARRDGADGAGGGGRLSAQSWKGSEL